MGKVGSIAILREMPSSLDTSCTSEAWFVTPEIIRNFCLAGQPGEIVERLKELESQGLDAVNFILPPDRQYRVTEDFARRVMARY